MALLTEPPVTHLTIEPMHWGCLKASTRRLGRQVRNHGEPVGKFQRLSTRSGKSTFGRVVKAAASGAVIFGCAGSNPAVCNFFPESAHMPCAVSRHFFFVCSLRTASHGLRNEELGFPGEDPRLHHCAVSRRWCWSWEQSCRDAAR
jgi:hypothetical protein